MRCQNNTGSSESRQWQFDRRRFLASAAALGAGLLRDPAGATQVATPATPDGWLERWS